MTTQGGSFQAARDYPAFKDTPLEGSPKPFQLALHFAVYNELFGFNLIDPVDQPASFLPVP